MSIKGRDETDDAKPYRSQPACEVCDTDVGDESGEEFTGSQSQNVADDLRRIRRLAGGAHIVLAGVHDALPPSTLSAVVV